MFGVVAQLKEAIIRLSFMLPATIICTLQYIPLKKKNIVAAFKIWLNTNEFVPK